MSKVQTPWSTATCLLFAAALSVLGAQALLAHDYWIAASAFHLGVPSDVQLWLAMGEHFVMQEARGFTLATVPRLVHYSALGSRDLAVGGAQDEIPRLSVSLRESGCHLFVLDGKLSFIELSAERFTDYLRHEGLFHIIESREARGEATAPGRERYTRRLKCLLRVGDERDEVALTVADQTLEIVPVADPTLLAPGESMAVQIRFKGQALVGATVFAFCRTAETVVAAEAVTDREGRAEFVCHARGEWLIRLVHMERLVHDPDAEWQSYWASFTFANLRSRSLTEE